MNLRQFISLIRVPSLSVTAAPLLVGGAIASRLSSFNPILWVDMFAVALLMQIATNVFNYMGVKGAKVPLRDSRSKLFSVKWRFAAFANHAQLYDLIMVKRINIFEAWENL